VEDKADEEHSPSSDTEDEKMYRDADKVESFGVEAPVLTGRLRALLEHLSITTAPRYRIKEVPCPGWEEFKVVAKIFFRSRVLYRHKGPAFRTSRGDAVADAAWQAITSWVCSNKHQLQNSIHYLLPYRKQDQFKAYCVDQDIPRMEMVHHQDVMVELSTHTGRSAQVRDSRHPVVERRCHHLRLHDYGRGSSQRPLCIRHRHLDSHLLSPGFEQGTRSEQPLPLQIPHSLGATQVMSRVISRIVWMFGCMLVSV
jgi:hypothetical protein